MCADVLGVRLGVALHGWVLPAMGDGVGLCLSGSVIAVYHVGELLPLVRPRPCAPSRTRRGSAGPPSSR
ncbi:MULTISPECIES: hypothetical protein [unclassified Streptomyces]|uniref:hypothetical protein n=1 Tax=unclassified Streptomyces TaxID=2593676 RepID=UPI001F0E0A7A|nr:MULTISPECIES: hypothetical protein [unclassified Streptomyces]